MWRLWHRLFGWHYVAIQHGFDDIIGRVQTDGDGRPYVRCYDSHYDLKTTRRNWTPLTFPRAVVEEAQEAADVIVMPRKRTG